MKERINRKNDTRVYQPRLHASRIKELYEVKKFTGRPMTVLLDEALSIYLAAFFTSPEYKAYEEALFRAEEEVDNSLDEPNTDDWDDMTNYLNL